MPRGLTINPAPFRSSNLSIPPSPFSPRSPLAPHHTTAPNTNPNTTPYFAPHLQPIPQDILPLLPPPPPSPLHWLWQCHQCNRIYQLAITRRCLDDGHYFCAGTTTVKKSKRTGNLVRRHRACASEFDYGAWRAWGEWRRGVWRVVGEEMAFRKEEEGKRGVVGVVDEGEWFKGWGGGGNGGKGMKGRKKDCWAECDYPSECRWGRQATGSSGPPGVEVAEKRVDEVKKRKENDIERGFHKEDGKEGKPEEKGTAAAKSFDEILLDIVAASVPETTLAVEVVEALVQEEGKQDIVAHQQQRSFTEPALPDEATKVPSMDELVQSAKRRKRRSSGLIHSPLAEEPVHVEEVSGDESAAKAALQKAFDEFEQDFKKSFGKM